MVKNIIYFGIKNKEANRQRLMSVSLFITPY